MLDTVSTQEMIVGIEGGRQKSETKKLECDYLACCLTIEQRVRLYSVHPIGNHPYGAYTLHLRFSQVIVSALFFFSEDSMCRAPPKQTESTNRINIGGYFAKP